MFFIQKGQHLPTFLLRILTNYLFTEEIGGSIILGKVKPRMVK